jgi:16S rRNA A1518/A1519 N6-dimethyltransferase RsmA/KsgA/DIM1 with predicted DNA glycosylase/AP lyase activity
VFQHRRKQVAGILDRAPRPLRVPPEVSAGWLEALGADPRVRPEQVSVEQWLALAGRLEAFNQQ